MNRALTKLRETVWDENNNQHRVGSDYCRQLSKETVLTGWQVAVVIVQNSRIEGHTKHGASTGSVLHFHVSTSSRLQ